MPDPTSSVEQPSRVNAAHGTSWTGVLFGIVVFLGGIALLLLTFKLAYDMFAVPPEQALHIPAGKPLSIELAVQSFAGLIIRVLLLLVMAVVGAIIANRGIKMYTDSRHHHSS